MSEKFIRLCDFCMIKWQATMEISDSRDCPKCRVDSFFTSNANDIGNAIYFERTGKSISDYQEFEVK